MVLIFYCLGILKTICSISIDKRFVREDPFLNVGARELEYEKGKVNVWRSKVEVMIWSL